MKMPRPQQQKPAVIGAILLVGLYTVGVLEIGRELGHVESESNGEFLNRQLRAARGLAGDTTVPCGHPEKMIGHVHIAKTGGTSINGILANRYERVCGVKGYSYDAFALNSLAEVKEEHHEEVAAEGLDVVLPNQMRRIGFEDCDYVSTEEDWDTWMRRFADGKFHDTEMVLHVPCRDPIEHLMSQCNHNHDGRHVKYLNCDGTEEEYFHSVDLCHLGVRTRFDYELADHFDVKCYDFTKQFTTYLDYMGGVLQEKRIVPDHYVKRDTNSPHDRESECIWNRPDLMEKTRKYLIEKLDYYDFCDKCLGTENDLTFVNGEEKAGIVSE